MTSRTPRTKRAREAWESISSPIPITYGETELGVAVDASSDPDTEIEESTCETDEAKGPVRNGREFQYEKRIISTGFIGKERTIIRRIV